MDFVFETDFSDLKLLKRGKVRDLYDLEDSLLIVATDRISAFDVVMPDPIPGKGKILTRISLFWFEVMQSIIPNHLISSDIKDYPVACKRYRDILKDRSMLVKKADPLPVECVIRGYITGSGWKSYVESGSVCGVSLPEGLVESEKLSEPVFTPSTKEETGLHDINIDYNEVENMIGKKLAQKIKKTSLSIYKKGVEFAERRGIIIADTKFEFGLLDNDIILIDELLTPDSSRFWPKEDYVPGRPQMSFDKQYLRDYLDSLKWDKKPPGPILPKDIIKNTRSKYLEALKLIAGTENAAF